MYKERNTASTVDMEAMTSEELKQLICTELDGSKDSKVVCDALRILKDRDTSGSSVPTQAMDAWNKYRKLEVKKPVKRAKTVLARIAAAAAVIVILTTTIPKVLGADNIIVLIGRWSRELFTYVNQEQEAPEGQYVFRSEHAGLQEIYNVVVSNGITQPVVPMWVPGEYQLEDVRVINQNKSTKIVGKLSAGPSKIMISIEQIQGAWQNKFTKDEHFVTELEIAGVTHYVVSNWDISTAIWHNEGLECYITTNTNEDELRKILLSIYLGE